jgi:MFS family permease
MAACLSTAAVAMTITASSVALASVQANLLIGLGQLQWLLNGFIGSFALFLLPFGAASDRVGTRALFLVGVATFSLAALWGVFAQSYLALVIARVIQGIGAALVTATAPAAVTHAFVHDGARKGAFGYLGASGGIGLTLGALLGGAVIGAGGWRGALALPIPVMALAGILVAATAESMCRETASGSSVGGMLGPLRHRQFVLAVALCLLFTTAWVALFIHAPLHMQAADGFSARNAANRMLALLLPALAMPLVATRLVMHLPARLILMLGLLAMAAGLIVIQLGWSGAMPGFVELAGLAISGAGAGTLYGLVDYLALSSVPPAEAGAASGMLNMLRLCGDVLAAIIPGAVVFQTVRNGLESSAAAVLPRTLIDQVAAGNTQAAAQVGLPTAIAEMSFNAGLINALWVPIALTLFGMLVARAVTASR